ncbi:penicillin acylase family protein [Olivibacter sp. XZL3]|uniref:penicillin acylase family protein n=1 Tax=Olivibacter sp. XZL3 TaxID=1735116 RepID=UPI001064A93C|nr:penicillin acylase family protein [Olivibacter sp. XZL3]
MQTKEKRLAGLFVQQSGDPESVHYRDLFSLWKDNRYFPVYFSKKKIEGVADQVLELQPK